MEKNTRTAQVVELLQSAAAALCDAAKLLAEIDAESSKPSEASVKQEPPSLTMEEVRAVLAGISGSGYTEQVRDLVHKYGGRKFSEIDPVYYADLINDAKKITNTA